MKLYPKNKRDVIILGDRSYFLSPILLKKFGGKHDKRYL